MPKTVYWSLAISEETDLSLRSYLTHHGMQTDDLSKFVEDAVRWRVLDQTVAEARSANSAVPAEEIEAAIDEAVRSVRADRFAK